MKLKDPCKRCIVRAGCSVPKVLCPEKKEYVEFRENIKDVMNRLTIYILILSFSTTFGYTLYKIVTLP